MAVVVVEVAPWALACLVRLRQDAAEVQRRHLGFFWLLVVLSFFFPL